MWTPQGQPSQKQPIMTPKIIVGQDEGRVVLYLNQWNGLFYVRWLFERFGKEPVILILDSDPGVMLFSTEWLIKSKQIVLYNLLNIYCRYSQGKLDSVLVPAKRIHVLIGYILKIILKTWGELLSMFRLQPFVLHISTYCKIVIRGIIRIIELLCTRKRMM